MNHIIEVKDVSIAFKKELVLNHISVGFEEGKIHGIIGQNGSGKTVLLKIICGLIAPDSGSVHIRGKQIGAEIEFPPDVGIIIETPGFLSYQSGYTNLAYLASIRNRIGKNEIHEVMRNVGLDPKLRKSVGKYSLGMRQRLGIAQAIMENPDILILDEPMNGLDKEGVAEMRKLFQNLQTDGKTILFASHIKDDIEALCDTVYEIDGGNIHKLDIT